jgi:hypothetical protein
LENYLEKFADKCELMPMKKRQFEQLHEIVCPTCGAKIDLEVIVNIFGEEKNEKKRKK